MGGPAESQPTTVMKDADADLVARARNGDMKAMEQLYRRHAGAVHAYARRASGREVLADEITQETFVRAFKSVSKFKGTSTFRTWLFSIAINTTRTHMKKANKDPVTTLEEHDVAVEAPDSTGWLKKRLHAALARLPEGYREVVVMHDVLDMRHEEIAAARACTVGTSKSQLHKARAKLRAILGGADA